MSNATHRPRTDGGDDIFAYDGVGASRPCTTACVSIGETEEISHLGWCYKRIRLLHRCETALDPLY